jgi:hypothetical protein
MLRGFLDIWGIEKKKIAPKIARTPSTLLFRGAEGVGVLRGDKGGATLLAVGRIACGAPMSARRCGVKGGGAVALFQGME